MFMVEIKGMRCLYTGDYSRQPDRHMPAADVPGVQPHIVIVESTFGTSNHWPREARERSFQSKARPAQCHAPWFSHEATTNALHGWLKRAKVPTWLLWTGPSRSKHARLPPDIFAAQQLVACSWCLSWRTQQHLRSLQSCTVHTDTSARSQVREIVTRGGRCLIPVVALGRAQELLLVLEDCWRRYPELQRVPIHQTSGTATQSLGVYQSYIEMMNDDIREAFKQRNPFEFRFVRHTRGFRPDSELGPAVVLATPSMLQTGLSRELFEAWCEDGTNGLIISDFAVQARHRYSESVWG